MSDPTPTPKLNLKSVPEWVWIAGAAVVVGAFYLSSRKKTPVTPAAQPTVGSFTPSSNVGAMPVTTDAGVTRILTNSDWSTAAQKDLIQKGHDPAQSAGAVAAYVAGKSLSPEFTSLVDVALKDIGPLPQTPGNGGSTFSRLHTPQDGNIFGQLAYGFASLLGLGDPANPIGGFIDPFLNDVIDQGPVSGVFSAATQILGANVNASVSGVNVDTPAGPISLGGNISNQGISVNGSVPGGAGGSFSLSPNSSASYAGTYLVTNGDTLESISQQIYGSVSGAQKIYTANLNKISDPSNLTPGTVLQIPSANSN